MPYMVETGDGYMQVCWGRMLFDRPLTRFVAIALFGITLAEISFAEEPILSVYNWFDYIAPDTIAEFTRATGIKVRYGTYDSNEFLESKLLAGKSGYDVVVPSATFLERQIRAGIYTPLDKRLIPNFRNLDSQLMRLLAQHDPGNRYAAMYLYGTTGIGYDAKQIKARMPPGSENSWRLLFDPLVVSKFRDCGVAIIDQPLEVVSIALIYLGLDANSSSPKDLKAAEILLMSIRPYVRNIATSSVLDELAQGDLCIILGWNGQVAQARRAAVETDHRREITYIVPKEGSIIWFDSLAIPRDAPHVQNAHRFVNFVLEGRVHGSISNSVRFANPNLAAASHVDTALLNDPGIYPPPEVLSRLVSVRARSDDSQREITRLWTRFRTGQ